MKTKITFGIIYLCLIVNVFSQDLDPRIEQKVDSVLSLMTMDEKIGQLNQLNGFWDATGPIPSGGQSLNKYNQLKAGLIGSMLNVKGVKEVRELQKIAVEQTRLGIPLIFGFDLIHGYKTITPVPLAEVSSWDMELIRKSAAMAAEEATAAGVNWAFGPMVDVSRDARWGRVMEGVGEDPYLASLVASARVIGYQGESLDRTNTLLACPKHYAGYGFSESGKDYNTVSIDDYTLHNFVMPPFKAAIDAGAMSIMTSFNIIQGVPATANDYLINEKLKKDWAFKGIVLSDWGSIAEMITHGFSPNPIHATKHAFLAGTDVDMEASFYTNHLKDLNTQNIVSTAKIDESVKRVLRVKFQLGLFDDPYLYCDETREEQIILSKANRDLVLEVALNSIVLLKNDTNLLPLTGDKKIALIGPLAKDKNIPLGNWSLAADSDSAVSIYEGFKNSNLNFEYTKGVNLVNKKASFPFATQLNSTDTEGIEEAVALAKKSDVVVLAVGEDAFQTGEGRSQSEIQLPGLQRALIEAVSAVNANIILVTQSGRPLDLSWENEHVKSIVHAWHLGTESGNAIIKVLTGEFNPSGKLPMSFPRAVGQLPIYYNKYKTGRPSYPGNDIVFWSHFTDVEEGPLFPFGYGLNYSNIKIENVKLSKIKIKEGDSITIEVTVKNHSKVQGSEVVQLYIQDLYSKYVRPIKELEDFEKVSLDANQKKVISFSLGAEQLSYLGYDGETILESGAFDIHIGLNSKETMTKSFIFE